MVREVDSYDLAKLSGRILKLEKCCGELIHFRNHTLEHIEEMEVKIKMLVEKVTALDTILHRVTVRIKEMDLCEMRKDPGSKRYYKPIVKIQAPPGVVIKVDQEH